MICEDQRKLRLPVQLISPAPLIVPAALAHGNVLFGLPLAFAADDVRVCMVDLFSAQFRHIQLIPLQAPKLVQRWLVP